MNPVTIDPKPKEPAPLNVKDGVFLSLVREYQTEHGVSMADAMREIVHAHPAVYSRYMAQASRRGGRV